MQKAALQSSHRLFRNENLHIADLMPVLGGCVHAADPQKLPPFLPGEIALAATHIVEVQDVARMAEVLDVVPRFQIVSEGLRVDQAAAEFMEDECHEVKSDKARDGVTVPRFGQ